MVEGTVVYFNTDDFFSTSGSMYTALGTSVTIGGENS